MTKDEIREAAKEESARLVEDLRRKNARSAAGDLISKESYERLQKLAERKIMSIARAS